MKKKKKEIKVISKKKTGKSKNEIKKINHDIKNINIENQKEEIEIHDETKDYGRIKWSLQVVDIDKLKPYEKNPRTITEEALNELASSFNEIGMCQPLVVSHDYSIISGNARYLQLKKEGCDKVQVMIPDRRLTEKQEKAVVIRMNKTVVGKWDYDVLANNYEVIDLMDWGFTTEELIGVDEEKIEPKCDEDEVPEVKDTVTKRGDIWLLGNHRVMCGDSTMIDDVEKLMKGEKADMVFTDPPYNIASDSKNLAASVSKTMNNLKNSEWDKNFNIEDALVNIFPYIENGSIYIWCSHFLFQRIMDKLKEYTKFQSWFIWNKPNPMPSLMKRHWTWNMEICCYATIGKHIFNATDNAHDLACWTFTKKSDGSHPTQKPIELCEHPILKSSNEKSLILDLFLGSGSTLIACEKTNRKCYGMELDEHYCDVIVQRWQKYTGKEAILESTGEKYNNLIK